MNALKEDNNETTVVRCKDCGRKKYCDIKLIYGRDENDFCSFGERKDDSN